MRNRVASGDTDGMTDAASIPARSPERPAITPGMSEAQADEARHAWAQQNKDRAAAIARLVAERGERGEMTEARNLAIDWTIFVDGAPYTLHSRGSAYGVVSGYATGADGRVIEIPARKPGTRVRAVAPTA